MSPHLAPLAAAIVTGTVCSTAAAGLIELSWIDRIDGPGHLNDYGESVAIAPDGTVYVTGFIFEQVTNLQGGTLYSPRVLTTSYDAEGAVRWQQTYAGTFASGAAAGLHVEVDNFGNAIVAGSTNSGDDWVALKYDSAGTELWSYVYEANSSFLTEPEDMAVDSAGNVYLVGYAGDFINPDSGRLVKINADGTTGWVREYYGPTFDGGYLAAVAVDNDGNVYAGGSAVVSGAGSEFAVVKYDAAGNEQWVDLDGAFGTSVHDRATDIAVDFSGNVVAVGLFGSNSAAGLDLAVTKLSPDGAQLWQRVYDGPGRDDYASAVAIDAANAVLVTGHSDLAAPGDGDALTIKYLPDGTLAWEQRVSGDEVHDDYASSVVVDGEGNAYICGAYDPIGGTRFFAARYRAADGLLEWFEDYAGPMGGGSFANDVALGDDGGVCVTGVSPDAGTGYDVTTIRYQQIVENAPGDVSGDGVVDAIDMLALLAAWGACEGDCPSDFNGDGVVDALDYLFLIANWS